MTGYKNREKSMQEVGYTKVWEFIKRRVRPVELATPGRNYEGTTIPRLERQRGTATRAQGHGHTMDAGIMTRGSSGNWRHKRNRFCQQHP